MKRKKLITTILTAAMVTAMSFSAFAGQWMSDASGWWWQNNDGSYPSNTWMWIDGNNDGISECYYFNENGYCLMNTTTPDGYEVNPVGAWIIDGVIQQQAAATDTTTSGSSYSGSSSSSSSSRSSRSAGTLDLTDLTPVSSGLNWGVETNVRTNQNALWSKAFGLNLGGNGYGEFYIGGEYTTMTFTMAPCQDFRDDAVVVVEVYGDDDDLLYESDELNYKSKPVNVEVDVSGQDYIKICGYKTEGNNSGVFIYLKDVYLN